MSNRVFDQISKKKKTTLREYRDSPLEQATGVPLKECGVSEMELVLDPEADQPVKLKLDVTIADIKDDVLLGLDAGNTVDVLASEKQVVIDGQSVPCVYVKSSRVGKVRATEKYEVPA